MRAVAAHARAHARMFVRTAARTLTPEETDACRKQIDALADKLDERAAESEKRPTGYEDFRYPCCGKYTALALRRPTNWFRPQHSRFTGSAEMKQLGTFKKSESVAGHEPAEAPSTLYR